jgi:molybdate transport system substrate-binding protein
MCLAVTRPAAAEEPARILATGVFASTLRSLVGPFETASGLKVEVAIANAGQVAARIAAGEPADLVMTSSASTKTLAKDGALVPEEVAIGNMRLGVAVPAGPMPDLTSADAFRKLLLSTGKIAYIDPNGGGTSGPFFEKMFASLGVADLVHAKAILCKDGAEVVRAVASGAATVGMTQASEIISAKEVKFAGFIPDALNLTTPYSASITAKAKNPKTAAAFLAFIKSPVGSERLRQAGWQIDR